MKFNVQCLACSQVTEFEYILNQEIPRKNNPLPKVPCKHCGHINTDKEIKSRNDQYEKIANDILKKNINEALLFLDTPAPQESDPKSKSNPS